MDYTKYENNVPYPVRDEVTTTFYYKAGNLVAKKVGKNEPAYTKKEYQAIDLATCVTERIKDEKAYVAAMNAYHAEERRIMDLFYADVKADLGITNNPKADKLMAKAWERGHSSGYQEVYNCACDLVELIED